MTTKYDFTSIIHEDYRDFIVNFFKKIHPDDDIREYFLKCLARQLYGDDGKNLFHFHTGCGSNGKSKVFELLKYVLGNYMTSFDVGILVNTQRANKGSGSPDPEKATWKGTRILVCSEPEEREVIHTGCMKYMSGGDSIKYRLLQQNEYSEFTAMYKIHVMCNNLPGINGSDTGVKRRIRTIPYKSEFVSESKVDEANFKYECDPCILEKFLDDKCKAECARFLFEHFDIDWKYEAPSVVNEASNSYVTECDKMSEFVQEYFVQDPDSFITLKEIKALIRTSEEYRRDVPVGHTCKTGFEKKLKRKCISQKKIKGVNMTNVFLGWRIKTE